jgi:hypothetical protein
MLLLQAQHASMLAAAMHAVGDMMAWPALWPAEEGNVLCNLLHYLLVGCCCGQVGGVRAAGADFSAHAFNL